MEKNEINGKILEIMSWWRWKKPGCNGYILTDKKIIYSYQKYNQMSNEPVDPKLNFFKEVKRLTAEEYQEIINWIKDNIIGKGFEKVNSRDAGNTIYINYDNYRYVIQNHFELYSKIEKLLKKAITKNKI